MILVRDLKLGSKLGESWHPLLKEDEVLNE